MSCDSLLFVAKSRRRGSRRATVVVQPSRQVSSGVKSTVKTPHFRGQERAAKEWPHPGRRGHYAPARQAGKWGGRTEPAERRARRKAACPARPAAAAAGAVSEGGTITSADDGGRRSPALKAGRATAAAQPLCGDGSKDDGHGGARPPQRADGPARGPNEGQRARQDASTAGVRGQQAPALFVTSSVTCRPAHTTPSLSTRITVTGLVWAWSVVAPVR